MPNQPKTKGRTFRIPDDLSSGIDVCAETDSTSATDVVKAAVREYLTRRGITPPSPPPDGPPTAHR